MNKKCGLLMDKRFYKHAISKNSPENPQRLYSLYQNIQDNHQREFTFLSPRNAGQDDITAVHSSFYLEQIIEHSQYDNPFSYDKDTYLMQDSLKTATLAAGGCIELADGIMAGEFNHGFGLIRPPGHHAEPGRGMGFCILNNVGITAQYLLRNYRLKRILILDFDAHHGNGTQEMFYTSDEVMVVSVHQADIFPHTGRVEELGDEKGMGFNINIPVHPQFGDLEYTYIIGKLLQSIAEQFLPQIILVSAGYDGHKDDSISSTLLSTHWFKTITIMLKQYARDLCDDRLLYILEGGYNPLSLEASILATLEGLRSNDMPRIGVLHAERAASLLTDHPLKKYWTIH